MQWLPQAYPNCNVTACFDMLLTGNSCHRHALTACCLEIPRRVENNETLTRTLHSYTEQQLRSERECLPMWLGTHKSLTESVLQKFQVRKNSNKQYSWWTQQNMDSCTNKSLFCYLDACCRSHSRSTLSQGKSDCSVQTRAMMQIDLVKRKQFWPVDQLQCNIHAVHVQHKKQQKMPN